MIQVIKNEYTSLSGWCSTEQFVDENTAIKIAANCNRGNANMGRNPEEWAKEKILTQKDFEIFKNPELSYIFKFALDKMI